MKEYKAGFATTIDTAFDLRIISGRKVIAFMTNPDHENRHIMATHQAIEQAVRDSYGRLLAFLAARSRDVAGAEDALADALKTALETWPRTWSGASACCRPRR